MTRPVLHMVTDKLRAYAEELGMEDPTGEQWVFDRVADAWPLHRIAATLGCSEGWLRGHWMTARDHPRRMEKYRAAQRVAADLHAERPEQMLEEATKKFGITSPEVSLLKLRADHQKWLAKVKDPERYGEAQAAVNVNLSLGDLHLEALREVGRPEVLEAELVVGEGDEDALIEEDTTVAYLPQGEDPGLGAIHELMGD